MGVNACAAGRASELLEVFTCLQATLVIHARWPQPDLKRLNRAYDVGSWAPDAGLPGSLRSITWLTPPDHPEMGAPPRDRALQLLALRSSRMSASDSLSQGVA